MDVDDIALTFFHVAKGTNRDRNFLTKDDFRGLLASVLDDHPGLDFLKVFLARRFIHHARAHENFKTNTSIR